MLFFKRGRVPGARSWELNKGIGKGYTKILEQLDESLKDLDLEVKKVEPQSQSDFKQDPELGEEESRYFVRLKGTLAPKESRLCGWRIDNLAALAAALALVVSKQGKSERKEIEAVIGNKAGRWRALTLMDTFLRSGYLEEDDEGLVKLGWRTRAELDLPSLMMLLAESKAPSTENSEPVDEDQASMDAEDSQDTSFLEAQQQRITCQTEEPSRPIRRLLQGGALGILVFADSAPHKHVAAVCVAAGWDP